MRKSPGAGPEVLLEDVPTRPWAFWPTSIGAFALAALLGVGIWLFSPSDLSEIQPPPNIESYDYVDGVLSEVQLPILVMNAYDTVEGEKKLTFRVPEANLRYFDVVHLRAHSSIGLPTRLYYERIKGELVAVYKVDAPANSGSGE
jgi:hypothetical protein